MTTRVRGAVSAFVVVAVAVVGCTSVRAGTPVGEGSAGASSSVGTYGAPRVSDPVDVTGFLDRPCAVLTAAQLAEFGVEEPGEPDTESTIAKNAGPGCVWHRRDTSSGSSLGMGFTTGNKNGLSDIYRGKSRFEFFVETTVDGYPAVFRDLSDGRPHGDCTITVGISDTLTFLASETGGPEGQIVCDRTKEVATAILATLKAGA